MAGEFVWAQMIVLVQIIFCLLCAACEQRLRTLHHVLLGCICTDLLFELGYSCLTVFFISRRDSALGNVDRVIIDFNQLRTHTQSLFLGADFHGRILFEFFLLLCTFKQVADMERIQRSVLGMLVRAWVVSSQRRVSVILRQLVRKL